MSRGKQYGNVFEYYGSWGDYENNQFAHTNFIIVFVSSHPVYNWMLGTRTKFHLATFWVMKKKTLDLWQTCKENYHTLPGGKAFEL